MRRHETYEFATAHNESLTLEHRDDIGDEEFDEFVGVAPGLAPMLQEHIQARNQATARDARQLAAFLLFHLSSDTTDEVTACLRDGRWIEEVTEFHESHKGLNIPATLEFASGLERVPEHKHQFERFTHRETRWPGQPGKTQPVHEFVCEVLRCGYRQMVWVDCAKQGCGMTVPWKEYR